MSLKDWLVNFGNDPKISPIRRKIVVMRSFMARAWGWASVPSFVLILAGVMKPYLQPYFDISMGWLAIIAIVSLAIIGYLERYLGFYSEDACYGTEQNKLLLNRLDTLEKKIDVVINDKRQNTGDQDSVQDS